MKYSTKQFQKNLNEDEMELHTFLVDEKDFSDRGKCPLCEYYLLERSETFYCECGNFFHDSCIQLYSELNEKQKQPLNCPVHE